MTYIFKDVVLSDEEFQELKQCVGEFRRICRDQAFRYVQGAYKSSDDSTNIERLKIADSLVSLLDRVEWLNHTVK